MADEKKKGPPEWFAAALREAMAKDLEQRAIRETADWMLLANEYIACEVNCEGDRHVASCQVLKAALAIATVACLVRSGAQVIIAAKDSEISELRSRAEGAERECEAIRGKAQHLADQVRHELGLDNARGDAVARVQSDDPDDTRCRFAAGGGSLFFRCILTRLHDGEHAFPKFDPITKAAVA